MNNHKGRQHKGKRAVCQDGHAGAGGEGAAPAEEKATASLLPAPPPAKEAGGEAGGRASASKEVGFGCDDCCRFFGTMQVCE